MNEMSGNVQGYVSPQPSLTQFRCDGCYGVIRCPGDGMLEYIAVLEDDSYYVTGFRIVHHAVHSPHGGAGAGNCYAYDSVPRGKVQMTCYLSEVVGPDAVAYLTNLIAPVEPFLPDSAPPPVRVGDIKAWAELLRRLTVPYYEEARLMMGKARADGFLEGHSEASIHSEATLAAVIARYE